MDTVQILVEKVQGRLKIENAVNWLMFDLDENGEMQFDETGMPLMLGSIPDVFYHTATFAVGECYFIADIFPLVDFMIHSNNYLYYRAAKPQVTFMPY